MSINRNEKCPCGSGLKYKKCCLGKESIKPQVPVSSHPMKSYQGSSRNGGINIRPYTIAKFVDEEIALHGTKKASPTKIIWTPTKVRALTTEEIVRKIESAGITFDEAAFLTECKKQKSAWQASNIWIKVARPNLSPEMDDFLGLAACILWERLNAPHVSYEMLDDLMQAGYKLQDNNEKAACDIWWKVWNTCKENILHHSIPINEADDEFSGTQSLSNWCQDFSIELLNASRDDREYAKRGVAFCSEYLSYFGDDKKNHSFVSDMAEMYALSGDQEKGESLMREFIEKHPSLARGYVMLVNVMSLRKHNGRDVSIEEQLKVLEQAKAYPVVDGEDYGLSDRIAKLKAGLKNRKQASA